MDDPKEQEILDQLPYEVQDRLFTGFIFNDFIQAFSALFRIEKQVYNNSIFTFQNNLTFRQFFTWNDNVYRLFMYAILQRLEPVFYDKGVRIFNELEEVNEISFIQSGQVGIGYECNKQKIISVRKSSGHILGDFFVTFNQKSTYLSQTLTNCKCFFIRKSRWAKLLDEFPEIMISIQQSILTNFIILKGKLNLARKRRIRKMMTRKDHPYIIMIEPKHQIDLTADIARDLFSMDNPYHKNASNSLSDLFNLK